jgi:hypothetical protein
LPISLQQVVEANQPHCPDDVRLAADYINDCVVVYRGGTYLFAITRKAIEDQPGGHGDFRHLLTERLTGK